jgi:hypothetical protein
LDGKPIFTFLNHSTLSVLTLDPSCYQVLGFFQYGNEQGWAATDDMKGGYWGNAVLKFAKAHRTVFDLYPELEPIEDTANELDSAYHAECHARPFAEHGILQARRHTPSTTGTSTRGGSHTMQDVDAEGTKSLRDKGKGLASSDMWIPFHAVNIALAVAEAEQPVMKSMADKYEVVINKLSLALKQSIRM